MERWGPPAGRHLHEFAGRLGLRREWFQSKPGRAENDHYDLTDAGRELAIELGAISEGDGRGRGGAKPSGTRGDDGATVYQRRAERPARSRGRPRLVCERR